MNEQTQHDVSGETILETANDEFKRSFSSWFWGSIIRRPRCSTSWSSR